MEHTDHHHNIRLRAGDVPTPLLVVMACGGLVAEAVGIPVISFAVAVGVVIWIFNRLDGAHAAADAKADHLAVVADRQGWDGPRGASGVPLRWVIATLRWVVPVVLIVMRIAVALVVIWTMSAVRPRTSSWATFVIIVATVTIATVAGIAAFIRAARGLGTEGPGPDHESPTPLLSAVELNGHQPSRRHPWRPRRHEPQGHTDG